MRLIWRQLLVVLFLVESVLLVSNPRIDHSIADRIEPSDRIVDPKFKSKSEDEAQPRVAIKLHLKPFNAVHSFPDSSSSKV